MIAGAMSQHLIRWYKSEIVNLFEQYRSSDRERYEEVKHEAQELIEKAMKEAFNEGKKQNQK